MDLKQLEATLRAEHFGRSLVPRREWSDYEIRSMLTGKISPRDQEDLLRQAAWDKELTSRMCAIADGLWIDGLRDTDISNILDLLTTGATLIRVTGTRGTGRTCVLKAVVDTTVAEGVVSAALVPGRLIRGRGDLATFLRLALGLASYECPWAWLSSGPALICIDDFDEAYAPKRVLAKIRSELPEVQIVVGTASGLKLAGAVGIALKSPDKEAVLRVQQQVVKSATLGAGRADLRSLIRRFAAVPLALTMSLGILATPSQAHVWGLPQSAKASDVVDLLRNVALELVTSVERDCLEILCAFPCGLTIEDIQAFVTSADVQAVQDLESKGLVTRLHLGGEDLYFSRVALVPIDQGDSLAEGSLKIAEQIHLAAGKADAAPALWRSLRLGPHLLELTEHLVFLGEYDNAKKMVRCLSRAFIRSGQGLRLERILEMGLRCAVESQDQPFYSDMRGYLGAIKAMSGEHEESVRHWTERAKVCQELGDLPGYADALTDMAWQEYRHGDKEVAYEDLTAALAAARQAQVGYLIALNCAALASCSLATGRPQETEPYRLDCLGTLEGLGAEPNNMTLQVLAQLALDTVDLSLAQHYISQLVQRSVDQGDRILLSWALQRKSTLLMLSGMIADSMLCSRAAIEATPRAATNYLREAHATYESLKATLDTKQLAQVQAAERSLPKVDLIRAACEISRPAKT